MKTQNTKERKETRDLTEVFRELEKSRYESTMRSSKKIETKYIKTNKIRIRTSKQGISLLGIILCVIILIGAMSSTNLIFATNLNSEDEEVKFEENKENVNIDKILSDNISTTERKELVTEDRQIEFTTTYKENPSLPKDEQVIIQDGVNGIKRVTVVKIYENTDSKEEFLEENILNSTVISVPINKIIEVGTSELLSKFQVHIGDIMYTTSDVQIKETVDANSSIIYTVGKYMDVKVIGVENNLFKIQYENYTGYVESKSLISTYTNPEYVEKCRMQKILNKVNVDMNVNESSGLTLEDFKKALSGNYKDVNKIFEDNAEVFYNIDKKYNVNGLLIASIGIHESAWGTSAISMDKHNLFGYGAYDSDPYNSAFTFETYQEGVETVAKSLVKNYINEAGTTIYDGETATGKYYNGSTIGAINIKYATDKNWGTAVYNIMEGLYEKLQ